MFCRIRYLPLLWIPGKWSLVLFYILQLKTIYFYNYDHYIQTHTYTSVFLKTAISNQKLNFGAKYLKCRLMQDLKMFLKHARYEKTGFQNYVPKQALSNIFHKLYKQIYLKGRGIAHVFCSSSGHRGQSWARPQPGAWSSILLSQDGWRAQVLWPSSSAFSGAVPESCLSGEATDTPAGTVLASQVGV